MRVLDDASFLLGGAGYLTIRPSDADYLLQFEDPNVLGFVAAYENITALLQDWKDQESTFLRRHAERLRLDPVKAWNVYAIFLTADAMDDSMPTKLAAIEEDLQATRKIARAGVVSRADVYRALAPLLPVSNSDSEMLDPNVVLKAKLDEEEATMFDLLRGQDADPFRIIGWLMEER